MTALVESSSRAGRGDLTPAEFRSRHLANSPFGQSDAAAVRALDPGAREEIIMNHGADNGAKQLRVLEAEFED